jgi:hypothetical protein
MLAQPLNSPEAPYGIPEDVQVQPIPGLDAYRVVLVNGHVVTEACDLPVAEGVICMPLFQALDEGRLQEAMRIGPATTNGNGWVRCMLPTPKTGCTWNLSRGSHWTGHCWSITM